MRDSGVTEATVTASVFALVYRKFFHADEIRLLDCLNDELCNAVTPLDLEHRVGIRINEHNFHFTAVARIDEARCVQHRDTVLGGKAATRLHKAAVARRNGNGDSGRHHGPPATGLDLHGFRRQQVTAGIVETGVGRERQAFVEALHENLQHGVILVPGRVLAMLAWMDLEMTGLDPDNDVIVEVATIITDDDLNIIAEGPDIVIKRTEQELAKMGSFVRDMHTKSGLLASILESPISAEEARDATLQFLKEHIKEERTVPLCGNSIGTDRRFLNKQWPVIEEFLHYRSIDVSTLKELARRWYPETLRKAPDKQTTHRALDDIRESIEELKYYREALFK